MTETIKILPHDLWEIEFMKTYNPHAILTKETSLFRYNEYVKRQNKIIEQNKKGKK